MRFLISPLRIFYLFPPRKLSSWRFSSRPSKDDRLWWKRSSSSRGNFTFATHTHTYRPARRKLDWTRTKCVPYDDWPVYHNAHVVVSANIAFVSRGRYDTTAEAWPYRCRLANAPGRGVSPFLPLLYCSRGTMGSPPKKYCGGVRPADEYITVAGVRCQSYPIIQQVHSVVSV